MSWVLVRVDDRLIHGQVVVAWGQRLRPARIWVIDDAAAGSTWERDIFASAAPGVDVRVVTVAQAAAEWSAEHVASGGAFAIMRSLAAAAALAGAGAEFETVNIGGLHYAPGRRKVNEYVYLGDADRDAARSLLARGIALEVQDVPATRATRLESLVPEVAA